MWNISTGDQVLSDGHVRIRNSANVAKSLNDIPWIHEPIPSIG